jgi:predicted Zn-dependent peptidase
MERKVVVTLPPWSSSAARQASNLDIWGRVDDRALTRVLAFVRKELDELGSAKPADDELNLLKWRLGLAFNLWYATNDQLAEGLVRTRLAGSSVDAIQKYPDLLATVTADDITRVGGVCQRTATLVLNGDPTVVSAALKATER